MKTLLQKLMMGGVFALGLACLSGCEDEENGPDPQLTGDEKTYTLETTDAGMSGTVTVAERDDDKVVITIELTGTQAGATHPAHVHGNTVAEGGDVEIDLNAVDGSTGKSETVVDALNDGTAVTYEDLLSYDGYVTVHLSPTDLGTFIAQADIGQNELTGDKEEYTLGSVSNPAISGTATFSKRVNDETLVTISLAGTEDAASYPSHIHANSAVETGGIAIDLVNVNGTTGMAKSNVSKLNDGTAITYDQLLAYNGYLNVHSGADLIAQGDIGGNELTGDNKVYQMTPVADPAVSGTATFAKRKNGNTLVTVALDNTQPGTYSSHIHANTIAEGGGIVINLTSVDGTTGLARSNVKQLNDGTPITYDQLLQFNGYLNVHGGGSFIVQGDIGQNEFTGDMKVYTMKPVADPAVSGTATFAERQNGSTLVTVELENTQAGTYSSHIHANTIAEGGGIVINLNSVDGTTGLARTNVKQMNDGTPITYDQLLDFNGYLNVHGGGSFIVQGDIGQNELTGDKKEYALGEVTGSGVSGTATFAKRKNGKTEITLSLAGTVDGGDHPAHIHNNNAATGGGIALDLENVVGATGMSVTSANALKDGTAITYDELIGFNGHINVHLSPSELGTRIAQGNIGSNVP